MEEAYKLAPQDHRILFELGLDYYYGEDRGTERDLEKALTLFEEAMKNAKAMDDAVMQNRIKVMLDKFAE